MGLRDRGMTIPQESADLTNQPDLSHSRPSKRHQYIRQCWSYRFHRGRPVLPGRHRQHQVEDILHILLHQHCVIHCKYFSPITVL